MPPSELTPTSMPFSTEVTWVAISRPTFTGSSQPPEEPGFKRPKVTTVRLSAVSQPIYATVTVLGFRADRLSGKVRHEIRVEVTHPDLTVRARKTYFQGSN